MGVKNQVSELQAQCSGVIATLRAIPYNKVDNYINNNITDLTSAKRFLRKLTKVILYNLKDKN